MQIRVAHFVGLCVACVSLVLFSNPIANSRFTAAAAFGTLFLAWIRPRSARWGYLFAGFMLIATLLIYPLANVFRSQTFNVWTGTEAFTSPDFDGFQQVINTLDYVSDYGHTWGIHILSGIGFFVPRSIWAAKAEPASEAIAANAGYVFTNLSLPIHAEFYLEFGWLGLLAGMAVLGIVAGRLDGAWLKAPGTKAAMVAPYVAFAMLGVIRGPIGGATPVWGAVVVLLMLGITSREKTSSPELVEAAERNTALK
ncbi:hypothetical protein [Arthrobacter sp. zg-Y238]|uniref:hypothetical protein n=1 Tax=Arthrobacter sp. zg-Y238 TaxID=2964614 RepID=UPI002106B660|nr:hypothetical protein [Arthrobacter sp. zg-Y238]MCQ1954396.1 hypothetical protein [Arthrobacter sp. zg-Y238]